MTLTLGAHIMGKYLQGHPSLFADTPVEKDIVYTPFGLAAHMIHHFSPAGKCLDPCIGEGIFHHLLPAGSDWCELEMGKDFFLQDKKYDWIIGNPPYSVLLAWIRHSMKLADNIVYLMPLHRVFASYEFLQELNLWGGIKNIVVYGTGAHAGFPFSHALGAVHYCRGWTGSTTWSYPNASEWQVGA